MIQDNEVFVIDDFLKNIKNKLKLLGIIPKFPWYFIILDMMGEFRDLGVIARCSYEICKCTSRSFFSTVSNKQKNECRSSTY